MILKTLTIRHFRQFRGTQQINFASDMETEGRNITVIFGENGRGKTGVFRALMFCLFGERQLSQDGDTPEQEVALVNTHELQEQSSSGRPVEAYVELEFWHNGCLYRLKRCMAATLDKGRMLEEPSEARLSIQVKDGNTKNVSDPEAIRGVVSAILDHRVREYFLFDGEKIERLTRASAQQRREISRGIKNLLNIDALETAIAALQHVCSELNSEIQSKSTGDYKRVLKEINDKTQSVTTKEERTSQIDSELSLATEEKTKVDRELAKFSDIKTLLQQRTQCEDDQRDLLEQMNQLRGKMATSTARAAQSLISGTLHKTYDIINEKKRKGEIPPEIRRDLIDRILTDGQCICGREVKDNTHAHTCILDWRKRVGDPGISESALELWRHLSTINDRLEETRQNVQTSLLNYAKAREDLEKCQATLGKLKQEIGTSERGDAALLEKHRQAIDTKIIDLQVERQKAQAELDALNVDLERLKAQRQQLEKEQDLRGELIQRSQLATATYEALREVFASFKDEIKERLSESATAVLGLLLDEESRRNLRSIIVSNDYSLQIQDRWGKPFLANISAGQRQIMSISFIIALAKAAAGGKMLEMPLFMDTPFGRLSFDHRKNLIVHVPELCAQWILLATDTELRRAEGRLLQKCGKWGRLYLLKSTPDGTTQIEERSTRDALALLLQDEEVTA